MKYLENNILNRLVQEVGNSKIIIMILYSSLLTIVFYILVNCVFRLMLDIVTFLIPYIVIILDVTYFLLLCACDGC